MKRTINIIAIMLCVTVCLAILATVASMVVYGPDHVKDEGRRALENTLSLLIGILSGFLGGSKHKEEEPKV